MGPKVFDAQNIYLCLEYIKINKYMKKNIKNRCLVLLDAGLPGIGQVQVIGD